MVWVHVADDIYQLWGLCEHDDAYFGSIKCWKFYRLNDNFCRRICSMEFMHVCGLFDSQNKRQIVS